MATSPAGSKYLTPPFGAYGTQKTSNGYQNTLHQLDRQCRKPPGSSNSFILWLYSISHKHGLVTGLLKGYLRGKIQRWGVIFFLKLSYKSSIVSGTFIGIKTGFILDLS